MNSPQTEWTPTCRLVRHRAGPSCVQKAIWVEDRADVSLVVASGVPISPSGVATWELLDRSGGFEKFSLFPSSRSKDEQMGPPVKSAVASREKSGLGRTPGERGRARKLELQPRPGRSSAGTIRRPKRLSGRCGGAFRDDFIRTRAGGVLLPQEGSRNRVEGPFPTDHRTCDGCPGTDAKERPGLYSPQRNYFLLLKV